MKQKYPYSFFNNMKYMFFNWFKWNKKSFIYLAVCVLALVVVPILSAYIPKIMIESIDSGISLKALFLRIAFLSLAIAGATWIAPYMQQKLDGVSQIFSMRYALMSFRKTMNVDFVDVESLAGREKLERSKKFLEPYNTGAPQFCFEVCDFSQCVVGILSSLLLLYKLPFLMILTIFLACIGEFISSSITRRYYRQNANQETSFFTKMNYFYNASHNFQAGKDIRLFKLNDLFAEKCTQILKGYIKLSNKFIRVKCTYDSLSALISMARDVIVLFYLITAVLTDTITVPDFIFYFGIVTGFSNYATYLTLKYDWFLKFSTECTKFREYVESEEDSNQNKLQIPASDQYTIEFKDVYFQYKDSNMPTLNGMSFRIQPGEKIAIVGENGAGKTTAVKLLCGLYSATHGEILVNGQNINQFSKDSYFSLFSVVFQDYHFLPISVAKNIALCQENEIDRQKLSDVLKQADIKEKIDSFEDQENSMMDLSIYRNAVEFSGGEKQKLLLARALYKDAPILILDEPTAALDPIAENDLYLQYEQFSKGKTSFFISHRLSSTQFCDRILFVADGKIAEQGTHRELMEKKGKYYVMYQLQSHYYKEEAKV